jgi:deoxyribonuclease V
VETPWCAAVDVLYPDSGGARAAAVLASEPTFASIAGERVTWVDTVAGYQPGLFYLRELPPIMAVLATSTHPLDLLVVDGYVDLDPHGRPGLGAHLHTATGVPVIGVAKTRFHTATHAIAVHRGQTATRPVHVTAAGLPAGRAADLVARMAGRHRLPDALRRADALTRSPHPTT